MLGELELHCTVLYCTALHCTALYYTVLCRTAPSHLGGTNRQPTAQARAGKLAMTQGVCGGGLSVFVPVCVCLCMPVWMWVGAAVRASLCACHPASSLALLLSCNKKINLVDVIKYFDDDEQMTTTYCAVARVPAWLPLRLL